MMRFQLLQALILINKQALLLFTVLAFVASQNPPIAKRNCTDRCGDVPIPYPFGTTEECYQSSTSFRVNCNHTTNPPKLFLEDTEIEIKNISLLGQMTIMQFVASYCSFPDGTWNQTTWNFRLGRFLTVNNTANRFTIVGCDSRGFVSGWRSGRRYRTGCSASCYEETDLEERSCMGAGCCQTGIPKNITNVNVTVSSEKNYTDVRSISNCTYGFLIEDSAFMFHKHNLTGLKDVPKVPMIVDWAIGNVSSCEEAQKNSSDYACISVNSTCRKPDNGYGYRCYCQDGYDGNPYIRDGCHDINECSLNQDKCEHHCVNTPGSFYCTCPIGYRVDTTTGGCNLSGSYILKLMIGIPTGLIFLLITAYLAYIKYNRIHLKKMKQQWFIQNGGVELQNKLKGIGVSDDMFKNYDSSDLSKATNDFHKSNIIGQGEFSIVYKGVLSNKTTVAIKEYDIVDLNSNRNHAEQFVNEVIILLQIQIKNENIVRLLGYCFEREIPLLVYEFSSDTLFTHLHDPKGAYRLNWEKRLKIATGIADVLLHLRTTRPDPITYRDVKSDNILFKDNYTTKVADFGKSRRISLDESKESTGLQEIRGYLDPEYFKTEQLTKESDVYSFGVILLELLTGRMAFKPDAPVQERSLVAYSQSMMKEESFEQLIDGNIASKDHEDQVKNVIGLAELCVKMNGDERPDMQDMVKWLKSVMCGSKQPFVTKQNAPENTQPLDVEGFEDFGGNTSVGYGSSVDQIDPPMTGGR